MSNRNELLAAMHDLIEAQRVLAMALTHDSLCCLGDVRRNAAAADRRLAGLMNSDRASQLGGEAHE